MKNNDDVTFLIFAKAPIPGLAKTRLIPFIGQEQAAELQKRMLCNIVEKVATLEIDTVQIWCTPDSQHPVFMDCQQQYKVSLYNQIEGDLGQKMAFGLDYAFQQCGRVIIVGTDCPVLSTQDIHDAMNQLIQDNEAVIIPAEDGGYVLIGLNKNEPVVFKDIDWGTNQVLKQTLNHFEKLNIHYQVLNKKWDVDEIDDLKRLSQIEHFQHLTAGIIDKTQ